MPKIAEHWGSAPDRLTSAPKPSCLRRLRAKLQGTLISIW